VDPEEELRLSEKHLETLRQQLADVTKSVCKKMEELEGRPITKKEGEEILKALEERKRLEDELKQADQSLQECREKVLRLRREQELVEERKRKEEQEIFKNIEEKKAEKERVVTRIEEVNKTIKLGETAIEGNLKKIKELEEEFQKWKESQAFPEIFEKIPCPPGLGVAALARYNKILQERRRVGAQIESLRAENKKIREGVAELQRLKETLEQKLNKIDEEIKRLLQRK
jgi:chromosome segregation ATPase